MEKRPGISVCECTQATQRSSKTHTLQSSTLFVGYCVTKGAALLGGIYMSLVIPQNPEER